MQIQLPVISTTEVQMVKMNEICLNDESLFLYGSDLGNSVTDIVCIFVACLIKNFLVGEGINGRCL